jgi:hypothetical protein
VRIHAAAAFAPNATTAATSGLAAWINSSPRLVAQRASVNATFGQGAQLRGSGDRSGKEKATEEEEAEWRTEADAEKPKEAPDPSEDAGPQVRGAETEADGELYLHSNDDWDAGPSDPEAGINPSGESGKEMVPEGQVPTDVASNRFVSRVLRKIFRGRTFADSANFATVVPGVFLSPEEGEQPDLAASIILACGSAAVMLGGATMLVQGLRSSLSSTASSPSPYEAGWQFGEEDPAGLAGPPRAQQPHWLDSVFGRPRNSARVQDADQGLIAGACATLLSGLGGVASAAVSMTDYFTAATAPNIFSALNWAIGELINVTSQVLVIYTIRQAAGYEGDQPNWTAYVKPIAAMVASLIKLTGALISASAAIMSVEEDTSGGSEVANWLMFSGAGISMLHGLYKLLRVCAQEFGIADWIIRQFSGANSQAEDDEGGDYNADSEDESSDVESAASIGSDDDGYRADDEGFTGDINRGQ